MAGWAILPSAWVDAGHDGHWADWTGDAKVRALSAHYQQSSNDHSSSLIIHA